MVRTTFQQERDYTRSRGMMSGLTASHVLSLRRQYGENRLPDEKRASAWSILFSQLKSPLVYIILVAALVSIIAGEYGDFSIIMVVVVVNALLGFLQEYQAQRTYTALKGMLKPTTTVIRDGERREVEVWELVPGDLVLLIAGEHVPADGELIEGTKIAVNEAILTGESEPVSKYLDESKNKLFMGTTVVLGRGFMRVVHTGSRTELGQIATSLQEHVEEDTPLQVRLKAFSRTLTWIVVGFTSAILIAGLFLGRGLLDMLRTSIILAIAAVPEGLLIAVTVILVLGMRKILKRNGLVKQLLAVETLGSVTVICTDKTGTLTEGRMRVTRTDLPDPERALQAMVLCNDIEGPVDIALWEYAQDQWPGSPQALTARTERLSEELFSSETKYMTTTNRLEGDRYDYLKGAPEIVLEMCSIMEVEKGHILEQVEVWAEEGLRLLGLAYRPSAVTDDHRGFIWLGLLGMEDPIREGVQESIEVARRAGIKVKMITGDYRKTAESIARNINLMEDDELIMEGEELQALTDEELCQRVKRTAIFSRIRPRDKLRIIRSLQANHEIAAMIGDGVNDAPALQQANIGVVVGNATDVAKETADLILLDSNFRTIVAAIEEGRIIFENIRKVVAYTLSNSFAEVLTIFTAMMLRWPAPLMVAQILWIHLICDGPADIVLGFEPKEEGIMDEEPKQLHEPILNTLGLSLIAIISVVSAIGALLMFAYFYLINNRLAEGRSIVFASLALNSMIYVFAYRSMRRSIFRMNRLNANMPLIWAVLAGVMMVALAFVIPSLRSMLGLVLLSWQEWLVVAGIAFGLLVVVEVSKWIGNIFHSKVSSRRASNSKSEIVRRS